MTDAQALFERGHAALEAGDYPEAVESLSRAIAADPRVAAGYRLRAKAYLALGDRPKAIADLDAAIRYRPNDVQAIAERAAELLKQRRFADAVADCDTALRLDPGRVDLFAVRGRAHALLGESAAAFADFDAAIHADADRAAEHLTQRAKLHLECGDPRAAIDDADTALRLDDECLLAYEVRALAHRDLGELRNAADDFERAARDPSAIAPRVGLLFVLHQLQEWVALAAAADELLARAPELPQALELRGRAALALGEPAQARSVFTWLIEKLPNRATGYALRASAHEAAGDAPSAVRDYLQALKCEPDDAGTLNQLAWLLATNDVVRNALQAKQLATRACELSSWGEAGYLDTLAVACAEQGELAEATAWIEKAILLDDRDEYRERLAKWRAN
jgi:tetratricopeptide (TPR) repeat protein